MTAYVIFGIKINNPDGYEDYKKLAPATISKYGGKYIVRGGEKEILEGDYAPERVVMLEFENIDNAKKWINSPEYEVAKKLRHKYASSNVIVVQGL
tara:strand:+ start:546 stop:833 length:288 start_codon:yes stop_codon:yes gene_type:complete